jgi:hypothetical protein
MTVTELKLYDEKLNRAAQRVLDTLERWDERFDEHYGPQRKHLRQTFRGVIAVLIPPDQGPTAIEPLRFQAWARNISRSGLAFIHPVELRVSKVLICLDGQENGGSWLQSEIVRARAVQDGFWEYGVSFKGRAIV